MDALWPRYLLLSDTFRTPSGAPAWRFVLSSNVDGHTISASDEEPGVDGDRLELLALVRGLEAIDQPARVTLATPSRYVRRGLKRGLRAWRGAGWTWERFGRTVSVRDADLWRRVDMALEYHRLECRTTEIGLADPPAGADDPPPTTAPTTTDDGRAPEAHADPFPDEPVLMVVRSGRRSLRIQHSARRSPRPQLAAASAG